MSLDVTALVKALPDRGGVMQPAPRVPMPPMSIFTPVRPPKPSPVAVEQPQGGAGTELKKLLAMIGIQPKPGCQCNARAAEMDRKGIAWCQKHSEMIIDWLAEEAKKRPLVGKLFSRSIAGQALKLAIQRARAAGYD